VSLCGCKLTFCLPMSHGIKLLIEIFTSNLLDSSLKHVLHSYYLCLISYIYIRTFSFDFISYSLDNQLSFVQVSQNSMAHSRINWIKNFVWFAWKYGHKLTSICDKNNNKMLWWVVCWEISLQFSENIIYIWNKTSKHIMSQCGKDFQSIPLHITYNFQHFEPIEHVNNVSKILHVLKTNNPNMIFNLDKFLSCSKSMNNFLHLIHRIKLAILLEWKFDSTFMEILKKLGFTMLDYVVSLFNIFCIQILLE